MLLYLLPVVAALILAASHSLAKTALHRMRLRSFLAVRSTAGLAFALGLLVVRPPELAAPAAGWALMALAVFLAPLLINVLYFRGLARGQLGVQGALGQSAPMFVVVLELVLLQKVASPWAWLGAGLIAAGCVQLLSANRKDANRQAMFYGIAAAFVAGLTAIVQRQVLEYFDKLTLVFVQNIVFAGVAASLFLLPARWVPITSEPDRPDDRLWPAVVMAVLSGLLVQVVFDYMKFASFETIGTVATMSLLRLYLVFVLLLGWLFFGEEVTWARVAGVGLVALGALLAAF